MPTLLITGANRGLGLEFVRQYAGEGWSVIATARDPDGAEDLRGVAGEVRVEALDVADLDAVARFPERLGETLPDLLIANAGTSRPERIDSADDARAWEEMLRVNAISPVLLARMLAPRLGAGAKLVAITSRMGSIADNGSGGWIPYRASKAALNAAWKSIALDLAPRGVVAAMLHPGWVQTRMGGPNAPLQPAEAVSAMRRTIFGIGPDQVGAFLNYDGAPIPW